MLEAYFKNKKIIVISPHFDDAILSVGMFLYNFSRKKDITVINIFTKAHKGPYSISAKKFLKFSGYANADNLYVNRKNEDAKVLGLVKVAYKNLGLTDALFRKKVIKSFLGQFIAELNHIYPTYRWHCLKRISDCDLAPMELENKLKKIVNNNTIGIIPFGIGNHVDHVIARKVCESFFKKVYYYVDFPYSLKFKNYTPPEGYIKVSLPVNLKLKSQLIQTYQSQVYSLFERGIVPAHREIFFVKE